MRKIFDFHGGIHPAENKKQSMALPIGSIPLAGELILPLNQHIGAPASPLVKVGEKVLKGQRVAEAQGRISAGIHASSSGYVAAIENRPVSHPSGMEALCIVIETDGKEEWIALKENPDPDSLDKEALLRCITSAGIAGMGGAGFPTSAKLQNKNIHTLILNAAECEPYITADDALIQLHAEEILRGTLILAKIIGSVDRILIGIEDNKAKAIECLNNGINKNSWQEKIQLIVVPTKYPSGGEKQLIKLLTGEEVPSAGIPANIGIVMQNTGTAYAVWQAVRHGEPLVSRVCTVVGKALQKQQNIHLPLGTPIGHILKEQGLNRESCQRVIIGGPMMGYTVNNNDIPIVKTSNCLLAPSHEELPPPPPAQACIRCAMCAEACPAELLPQQLYWYARAEDNEKLQAYNLFDCIECGACSYVCPSSIPLVQYYRAAKGSIRTAQEEKKKSDQARQRFEARQQRLAKEEAAKAAKREARKKAAEEAKRKKAEEKTQAKPSGLVEQAEAAASSKQVDPAKELAKLQRSLSSAESRLQRANDALSKNEKEGADQERLEALKAKIKQAEQKVNDARDKLAKEQTPASATGLVDEAIAAASSQEIDPTKALAKLKRSLSSAESRLQRANDALSKNEKEGADQERLEALKAKIKQAEQKVNDARDKLAKEQTPASATSLVDEAVAAASSKEIDPTKALAKLKRSLSSAESRLQRANDALSKNEKEGADQERLEALKAKIKQAEQKVNDARDKLDEANS